jgi:hypothetical protein
VRGDQPADQVGQPFRPRAGQLAVFPLVGAGGQGEQRVDHRAEVDRLDRRVGNRGRVALAGPAEHLAGEVVELRGPRDADPRGVLPRGAFVGADRWTPVVGATGISRARSSW